MVETYSADEERFYYVVETVKGTTPANPAMLSVPQAELTPDFDPGNLLLRGGGSFDLQAIKPGIRKPAIRVKYPLPSVAPIDLLQYVKRDLDKSLSCQVLYHKGSWTEPTNIISLLYTYMRIGKASVSCEIDGVIEATLELLGQNLTTGTAKIAGATYTDYGGVVAFNEASVLKDLTPDDRVTGWSFSINNNVKQVPVIRSSSGTLAKYVTFGNRGLSGEVKFEFESKAEMDAALADSEFDLKFMLSGSNNAVFPDCHWSSVTHEKWLDDLIAVRAAFDSKGPLTIASS
ncbi:MAG: phage tail tube protein [Candidatus Bathyarchaeota archaeon]|nr:phage tail tube protein [Candidatus Bathyarchaeota archaeon]